MPGSGDEVRGLIYFYNLLGNRGLSTQDSLSRSHLPSLMHAFSTARKFLFPCQPFAITLGVKNQLPYPCRRPTGKKMSWWGPRSHKDFQQEHFLKSPVTERKGNYSNCSCLQCMDTSPWNNHFYISAFELSWRFESLRGRTSVLCDGDLSFPFHTHHCWDPGSVS